MDESRRDRIRARAKALWQDNGAVGRIEDHLSRAEEQIRAEDLADLERNVREDVSGAQRVGSQVDTPVGQRIEELAAGSPTRRPPD